MAYGPKEKQYTVRDWETHIRKSPTRCKRSIKNSVLKYSNGHPLSTSEQNLLEAALNTGDF